MNAFVLLILALVSYGVAYKFYGFFLSTNFELDAARKTPAHESYDGVDFVPAKNWWVLFGHHFSSICGAGPIVGPALACAYWGWGVSAIWIVVGAIWMGAVSDFSSLIISVREKGKSIANISGDVISKKARFYFSIFLWISLILVIAVFAIFGAKTFIQQPDAVVPSFGLIPTALLIGWMMYQKKIPNILTTILGLSILVGLLFLGRAFQVSLPGLGALSAQNTWIFVLLVYCFIASVVPVHVLLQPRDYLASFVLFALIFLGIAGIAVIRPEMQLPAFIAFKPEAWSKAGPLVPMLFVTIACGAISGFHSLVSSGTTCKQLASEGHACRIGYGGMLVESIVGILVLICVSAGLSQLELNEALKNGGPILAFSRGYGVISEKFLGGYGVSFAVLALNAFILTTLDSATRITRYLTAEIFGVSNKYLATAIVCFASAVMAFTGKWNLLWPAFGAANQLIAGITLLIASCWLLQKRKNIWVTLIPACLMLLITILAFGFQFFQAVFRRSAEGVIAPDWVLIVITAVLIVMAFSIIIEGTRSLKKQQVKNC